MDTEKSTLDQNLSFTEATREKIESELIQSNRERKELIESLNQATRERDGYHDELVQARRELDRQSNNVVRLAREKEDLTKEKSNLIVQLTGAERDNRTMSEVYGKIESVYSPENNKCSDLTNGHEISI